MVAVYHAHMLTEETRLDITEWFYLLRKLGREDLSREEMTRMSRIEHCHRHENMLGIVLGMLRQEYIQDIGHLALRIALLDEYFRLPWYRRIFSKPRLPSAL